MSEVVPGVTITCEKELVVLDQMENVPLKWQFKIKAEVGFEAAMCIILTLVFG